MCAASCAAACASDRRSSPSPPKPAEASNGCSTRSRSCSTGIPRGSRPPELNRALGELREARQPPSGPRGRRLNLLYGAQVRVRPPRFRLSVNDPALVTRDYGYWVENQLRARFGLEGVPVSIDFVKRS